MSGRSVREDIFSPELSCRSFLPNIQTALNLYTGTLNIIAQIACILKEWLIL